MAETDFSYESRLKGLPDPQKIWTWELQVNLPLTLGTFITGVAPLTPTELITRVRNVVLPGRTITPLESFFMGTKSFYPGKAEYTSNLQCQMEEYEDQKVHATLTAWQKLIFDYQTGKQGGLTKREIATDIILRMYKSEGTQMPKTIKFFNCWPTNVADVNLDYAGSDSVKFDVTFQYDFWRET